jgi:ATP-dependent Clp protease ATP-binding subunit ClpX
VRAQQALLKIMEGTVASVPRKAACKHPQQEFRRSTPRIFCSSAVVRSPAWRRSSPRVGARSGFAAQVLAPEDRRTGEIFRHVEPEDS